MLGRAFTVGMVTLSWFAGGPAQALAADASFIEREPRSQQVIVVKPDSSGQPSVAEDIADKVFDLKQAIREEEPQRNLLQLKLNLLRERVLAERMRLEGGRASASDRLSSPEAGGEIDGREAAKAKEAINNQGVIREYIWIPQHREGDKIIEGHYQLRTK